MPRKSTGPRLWFDKKRGTWTIIDGRRRCRTGIGASETRKAEAALGDYIASKHVIKKSSVPFISDVLASYADEHLSEKVSEKHILYDIKKLAAWWGAHRVDYINAATTRAYAKFRKSPSCARRELLFLRAALKRWNVEHTKIEMPAIILPPAPPPRQNYISRSEAAKFLWAARRSPHLSRFFIIGWYTGSRRSVITGLRWSMVDFKSHIMLRKPANAPQPPNKKSPPVRMGTRLLAHMKRWKRLDGKGADYVVTWKGKPIFRPLRTWERARVKAGLPEYVTPHILRHSRATNMMKQGKDPWESAKALGMSLQMLTNVYGHHNPDWQKDVSETR